ncbi:hypothetical protein, partial [Niallia circulans]|uniref:hypothetical protein n=1 Tax=Niallia circulans TaxID=1397 RepID=UPI00300BF9FB
MGEKIGTIDYLKRQGIIPINIDNGINMFLDLVQSDIKKTGVIVSSRMGKLSTMQFNSNKGQFLGRFLENKLIEYPGVELISEVELHNDQDQYLNEHEINNEKLFPAVMM